MNRLGVEKSHFQCQNRELQSLNKTVEKVTPALTVHINVFQSLVNRSTFPSPVPEYKDGHA